MGASNDAGRNVTRADGRPGQHNAALEDGAAEGYPAPRQRDAPEEVARQCLQPFVD